MRTSFYILGGLLIGVMLAGCGIHKQPLSGDQIGEYWYLEQDPWPEATKPDWEAFGHRVPTRFTILKQRSTEAAIFSLVRTGFEVMQGADEVQVGLTPDVAAKGANLLRRARLALQELKSTFTDGHISAARWAKTVSGMLVTAEEAARILCNVSGDSGDSTCSREQAQALQLVLQVVAAHVTSRPDAVLNTLRSSETTGQIDDALLEGVLQLSFSWAGKETPLKARQRVQEHFAKVRHPSQAQGALQEVLRNYFNEAPAAETNRTAAQLEMALTMAPALLEGMESFARQWDKVRAVNLEIRKAGEETIASVTLEVEKGQQIRLVNWPMPTLVFTGTCRITLVPTYDPTQEMLVLFQGEQGGSCEVRYEGLIYALARLAVPVDNARLREIRLQRHGTYRGWNLTNVELLMETLATGRDPRCMYALQSVTFRRPVRGPFDVEIISTDKRQSVSYLRPAMRYTWQGK